VRLAEVMASAMAVMKVIVAVVAAASVVTKRQEVRVDDGVVCA